MQRLLICVHRANEKQFGDPHCQAPGYCSHESRLLATTTSTALSEWVERWVTPCRDFAEGAGDEKSRPYK